MFREAWGEELEAEQEKVKLFEVELPENSLERRDISLYDAAYDAIHDKQDIDAAVEYARRYFASAQSEQPNWEYLSATEAKAVKDISVYLREQKS